MQSATQMPNKQVSAKQLVETMLHDLPDDSTLEDIQCHLFILQRDQRSSASVGSCLKAETPLEAKLSTGLSQKSVEERLVTVLQNKSFVAL